MSEKLHDHLAYPPRAMRAERAAAYLSMSRSKFLELVDHGKLPKPTYIDGMVLWDRLALELAFEEMASDSDRPNSFDVIVDSLRK
jgi:predicted DNA-binding transcriptional regulator AlpA